MKLESIELINYNEKYKNILEQINKDNLHHYVKQVDERLLLNGENVDFKLDCGYLVKYMDKIIGYVYLSNISNYRMYIEYLILFSERNKGYGHMVLKEITDFILSNYNIKRICLDIDKSNLASMNTALSCGYMYEDDDLIDNSSSIEFSLDNAYFISKKLH